MAAGIKTGGRSKGTPNKTTVDLRNRINNFLSENWDQLETDFRNIEPKERIQFYEKLIQYSIPKLQNIEYISDTDKMIDKLNDQQLDELLKALTDKLNQ